MGRICHDLELKTSQNGDKVFINFRVAVDRKFGKSQDGSKLTDFFNAVAFGKTAEFINNYFAKGKMILIDGEMQCDNYTDKDGKKCYSFKVMANTASFTGEKGDTQQPTYSVPQQSTFGVPQQQQNLTYGVQQQPYGSLQPQQPAYSVPQQQAYGTLQQNIPANTQPYYIQQNYVPNSPNVSAPQNDEDSEFPF
jgi:single-strand DNA-binding protein